jgi:hypothetical protein
MATLPHGRVLEKRGDAVMSNLTIGIWLAGLSVLLIVALLLLGVGGS